MKPSVILERAAKLIKKGWCRWWAAVDKNGIRTDSDSKDACRWCALGAIQRVGGASLEASMARAALGSVIANYSIGNWNDHAPNRLTVIAGMKRAAAKLREEGR